MRKHGGATNAWFVGACVHFVCKESYLEPLILCYCMAMNIVFVLRRSLADRMHIGFKMEQ